MEDLIKEIKSSWGDKNKLRRILLEIVVLYREQARTYANAVLAEASTFNAEMEDTFKPSITKAEFRAKEMVGSTKIIAEREMKALELLYDVVKMVIISPEEIQGS